MPSIAFLLTSILGINVRSHFFPFARLPLKGNSPSFSLSCVRRPLAISFSALTSGCLGEVGMSGRT